MADSLTLGDAGSPNDDSTYDGADTMSVSMDYFRSKYLQFQQALNSAHQAYEAGTAVYFALDPSDPNYEAIYNLLIDYDARAAEYRRLAETLNVGANIVNAVGGRLPVLSLPPSLGVLPAMVMPAAVVLALAAASAAIAYLRGWAGGMARQIEIVAKMPENSTKPQIIAAMQQAHAAENEIMKNPISGAADLFESVKKLAIVGVIGYFAWQYFKDK